MAAARGRLDEGENGGAISPERCRVDHRLRHRFEVLGPGCRADGCAEIVAQGADLAAGIGLLDLFQGRHASPYHAAIADLAPARVGALTRHVRVQRTPRSTDDTREIR